MCLRGKYSRKLIEYILSTSSSFFFVQIIQSFFVSALTGTITAELTNFLNNPEQIVDLLANSLPAQSSYFIQICLVFTFLLHGLDLIRAYPLGVAFLRRFCFGPNLTREERRKSWGWFSSLEDPPDFWHAELLAQIMLFFVVFFVYSVIAPITRYEAALFFPAQRCFFSRFANTVLNAALSCLFALFC